MRECLGMEFFETLEKKQKEQDDVYRKNFSEIKKELKSSIKKTYNLEVGEILGRVEILMELLQEFDDTLKDLDGEELGKKSIFLIHF